MDPLALLLQRSPARRGLPLLLLALLLLAAALTGPLARADTAEPTISTDRPSVANSSVVVPQGALQMENGLTATNLGQGTILDLPESSLRYGLLARTELRLALPDYFNATAQGAPSGFGDIALGVKQQLGPLTGFDVSLIAFASLPSGASSISSHGYDPGLQLPWSRALAPDLTLAGQFAAYGPTVAGRRNYTSEATVLLDRSLNARSDVFGELALDAPQRGGSRTQLHLGTTYKLTTRQQLDFHVAAGLSAAAPRSYIGVGYSFLIPGLTR